MPLVVPDSGEIRLLQYIVNKTSPTNLVLHLYTNEIDLSLDNFVTSDFSEASASGYSPVTLTGAGWTASTTSGVSAAIYDSGITFSFTVGQDIQGYYVTDTSNNILWAEEFPGAPFALPTAGGDVAIRPQIQLS